MSKAIIQKDEITKVLCSRCGEELVYNKKDAEGYSEVYHSPSSRLVDLHIHECPLCGRLYYLESVYPAFDRGISHSEEYHFVTIKDNSKRSKDEH